MHPAASPLNDLRGKELGVQRILFIVAFYKVLQRKGHLRLKLSHLKAERDENYEFSSGDHFCLWPAI